MYFLFIIFFPDNRKLDRERVTDRQENRQKERERRERKVTGRERKQMERKREKWIEREKQTDVIFHSFF